MSTFIHDEDGDQLRLAKMHDGRLTVRAASHGEGATTFARVGPIDPHALIAAIHEEMGWDAPAEISPTVQAVADQINSGEAAVRFPQEGDQAAEHFGDLEEGDVVLPEDGGQGPDLAEDSFEYQESLTAESEKEDGGPHSALAEHWQRRLDVAQQALAMTPRRGESKPLGFGALFGTERGGEVSVTDALKIARFAADEERNIPGVDVV